MILPPKLSKVHRIQEAVVPLKGTTAIFIDSTISEPFRLRNANAALCIIYIFFLLLLDKTLNFQKKEKTFLNLTLPCKFNLYTPNHRIGRGGGQE